MLKTKTVMRRPLTKAAASGAKSDARTASKNKKQSALSQRLTSWWHKRLPQTDHLQLSQRYIYILPSRSGLLLALTLLLLLVAAINYQLSLGYLLCFLLISCSAVNLFVTHAMLRGLDLSLLPPDAVFAGERANLEIRISNPSFFDRPALCIHMDSAQSSNWLSVPAQSQTAIKLGFQTEKRGRYKLPHVCVQNFYPMGIFRAWAIWRVKSDLLVYPDIERPAPPLPLNHHGMQVQGRPQKAQDAIDFDGLRTWRRGDPMKRIVWKKFAQSGELITREMTQAQGRILILRLEQTGLQDREAQVSRLTAWIVMANQAGLIYGLDLPETRIPAAQGPRHLQDCLTALALY